MVESAELLLLQHFLGGQEGEMGDISDFRLLGFSISELALLGIVI